jgi:hypothetical protein
VRDSSRPKSAGSWDAGRAGRGPGPLGDSSPGLALVRLAGPPPSGRAGGLPLAPGPVAMKRGPVGGPGAAPVRRAGGPVTPGRPGRGCGVGKGAAGGSVREGAWGAAVWRRPLPRDAGGEGSGGIGRQTAAVAFYGGNLSNGQVHRTPRRGLAAYGPAAPQGANQQRLPPAVSIERHGTALAVYGRPDGVGSHQHHEPREAHPEGHRRAGGRCWRTCTGRRWGVPEPAAQPTRGRRASHHHPGTPCSRSRLRMSRQ